MLVRKLKATLFCFLAFANLGLAGFLYSLGDLKSMSMSILTSALCAIVWYLDTRVNKNDV